MTRPRSISRPAIAWTVYAFIVAVAAGFLLVDVVQAVRFWPTAPSEFWLLTVLALVIELSPLTIPQEQHPPTRLAVSLCLTFAILLLWDAAPAVVVQAVALGVAQLRVRRPTAEFVFVLASYTWAFQVAGLVQHHYDRSQVSLGVDIATFGVAPVVATAMTWFVVNYAAVALMLTAAGPSAWHRWAPPTLLYDCVATAGLLMLAPAFITAPTGWTVALLAIPLVLFAQVSRVLRRQEQNINRDPLTRLRNVRGLSAMVDQSLAATNPAAASAPRLAFILVRLNGLGQVTSVFGRQVTDDLVRQAGDRLTAAAGDIATVGRIYAADFAVLVPGADSDRAVRIANRVAADLSTPIDVDEVAFSVTPKVGVAMAPADGADLTTLTARAEAAMMDPGSITYAVRESDEIEAQRRLAMLVDLRGAVEEPARAKELFPVFQPQVNIRDGSLAGVEALVRWQHPRRGLVDTVDMITTVEASSLMQPLTLHVVDAALDQLALWSAAGLRIRLSVNASAKDFASDRFAGEIKQRLAQHGIPPEQLDLEITETALVTADHAVDRTVGDLVAMGVGLSLDDFGTGYASLQQLRRYPLRELKIDRSYITAITSTPTDRIVVTGITRMATELGLRVVAEGVEDEPTAELLATIGPLIGQGWFFGRPMPGSDLVAWAGAHTRSNKAVGE